MGIISGDGRLDLVQISMVDVIMANFKRRGCIAAAHAGRTQHTDFRRIKPFFKGRFQLAGTGKLT